MRIGFFEDAEELRPLLNRHLFGFLESEKFCGGLTPMDFIHGYCEFFACHLWQKYKWPVKKTYANGKLVHAYCEIPTKGFLVDVRGATTDKKEFWEEFSNYLFGWHDHENFEAIESESASDSWLKEMTAKNNPDAREIYQAAKEIDNKYGFWNIIATNVAS